MTTVPKAPILLVTLIVALVGGAVVKAEVPENAQPGREFEFEVRSLFFKGLQGDMESFAAAMQLCDDALELDPDDAEALVWRGSGTLFRAGLEFQQGDWQAGTALWQEGLDEMDRAVSLAPEQVAVRIPRGATLIGASRSVPSPQQARELLEIAVRDYEKVVELQTPYFDRLSQHARGELLIGLTEAYARLDEVESAMATVDRLRSELAGSEYVQAVDTALADERGLAQLAQRTCSGCHH